MYLTAHTFAMTVFQASISVSSPHNVAIMAAIGAAAGVYLFYRGFRLLQRKRLIINTPASKIRSASMGLVEISGLAAGPYVITSALKQLECYYYRSIAWEWKQRGRDSEWVKVAEESFHVPFYIDDNTGKVLVDPRGAEMDLHCDLKEEYNRSVLFGGPEMPGCVSDFLVRHAANPDKRIKVEEYCIKPKNFLFVLGTLSQNPGLDVSLVPPEAERAGQNAGPGVFSPDQEVIMLSQPVAVPVVEMTQQQKVAAALIKAGITRPAAWAAAGAGTPASALPSGTRSASHAPDNPEGSCDLAPNAGFDLHPPIVLMKGTHDPAFLISWRSPRDVVASLSLKSTLMIWGGPALTLVCVYVLLAHFNWL